MGYRNSYNKYFITKHYTLTELIQRANEVNKFFCVLDKSIIRGKLKMIFKLKPTKFSIEYKILLTAKLNSTIVKIFVIEPKIESPKAGEIVPHLFNDNSLCLYYPKYHEWTYKDSWVNTLVPWTSLWLYYYEIWKETGVWTGGGIHRNVYTPML